MTHTRLLALELLEDRTVPALFGIPWYDPTHLSISFAPDGTTIAGHESEFFATLDQQQDTSQWQRTILRAFQTWALYANLNFAVENDAGDPFGTAGLVQGDPRFGDIRIGAHGMSPEVLAIAVPPGSSLSGTLGGDIFLNSEYAFDGTPYSLLGVMLHEAGHALGLANSAANDAVMYTLYNRTRTTLSTEDITRIRSLYGARQADAYEGPLGNNSRTRASALRLPTGFKGETPLVAFGDITVRGDADVYSFSIPADGNDDPNDLGATIRLQTAGVSLLTPKLTIVDQNGVVLARQVSTEVTGDILQVKLTGLNSGQRYFVRVEAATQDVFGIGRYGLSVRLDKTSSVSDQTIDRLLRGPFETLGPNAIDAFFRANGDVLLNADTGGNDLLGGATAITPKGGRFEAVASLAKSEDVDFYRIVAPTGGNRVLTVSVWTADQTGFQPTVTVLNANGNAVPASILANGNGTSTVQVENTAPGAVYYLRVGLASNATEDKGNYFLGARFGTRAVQLDTFATGGLDKNQSAASTQLYLAQTQLFHFVLTAGPQDPGATVRLTIRDDAGNVVYSLAARSGSTASASSVLLAPGAYRVTFEIDNPNGPRVTYRLRGLSESNPIGPVLADPTLSPQYTTPSTAPNGSIYNAYPSVTVPYNPATLPGYVNPANTATYPPGFRLPPDLAALPWLIVTTDPFYWLALGL